MREPQSSAAAVHKGGAELESAQDKSRHRPRVRTAENAIRHSQHRPKSLGQHAYLIFFGSEEKNGQVDPELLEFESEAELNKWLGDGGQEYLDRCVEVDRDAHGGWPTWHCITPGGNSDPWEALKEWKDDQDD